MLSTRAPLLGLLVAAAVAPVQAADREVILDLENVDCAACGPIVTRALKNVEGVKEVMVSSESGKARVLFDDASATLDELVEATTNSGFPARVSRR